jgi:hypothetical protein
MRRRLIMMVLSTVVIAAGAATLARPKTVHADTLSCQQPDGHPYGCYADPTMSCGIGTWNGSYCDLNSNGVSDCCTSWQPE